MKLSKSKLTETLRMLADGKIVYQARKVQEHFKAFYSHNSSHKSIYKWVVKYSDMISNFTDKLKINSGKEIQIDEMEYHRRTNPTKKGVSKEWFIGSHSVLSFALSS